VSLDAHLSGAKTGANGRHPLPSPEVAAARFGQLGVSRDRQVVLYDADVGMYAARGWWMLRWLGHRAVAVLDGGLAAWVRAGLPLSTESVSWAPVELVTQVDESRRVDAGDVLAKLGDPSRVLVDARAGDRFRGENETLDPVGGHIPGAVNRFFQLNLGTDKTFKPAETLRAEWTSALGGTDASGAVMYCGSGVTACHNLLALEHAGLSGARLFPGSWSEWCADPMRPRADLRNP
jgi:thiosulfate/3-mercaptopyruvate sulfurtransferase